MNANIIKFNYPAEDSIKGWENNSLCVGNGFLGASIFSDTEKECIAISEHTLSMPPAHYYDLVPRKYNESVYCAGNECFEKVYIETNHKNPENYERILDISKGVHTLTYTFEGVDYKREAFASYPEKCFVMKLSASKKTLDFYISAVAPYVREFLHEEGDHLGRSGETRTSKNEIIIEGVSEYYNIIYQGNLRLFSDGEIITKEKGLEVKGASWAYFILAVGTNYELDEDVDFSDRLKVLEGKPHPDSKIRKILDRAEQYDYDQLLKRHLDDFMQLYNRVEIDFGGKDSGESTDKLFERYRKGEECPYLEELHFNMGRYLLLSSSRIGGLPSALQGIWNYYKIAPWTNGYWYNVNIQMNYWHAFTCNMQECFVPYNEYNKKRLKAFRKLADEYIKQNHPENYEEGNNGWIVGTGNGVLFIGEVGGHSGPGTGGLTTQAYLDWYDFTLDKEILRNEVYPFLEGMARFYTKCVKEIDGKYLALNSFSPEQFHNGKPYETIGCAFDQQMIYENNKGFLRVCELLEYKDVDMALVETVKKQIDKYEPVLIGKSGQVKEYREEEFYGDIGEKTHRHISHLCGLYPGSVINSSTKEWLEGAKVTLRGRGFASVISWAKAHKALMYARAHCTEETYAMLRDIIEKSTFENMWGKHDDKGIFQIDGSFGSTAAYAEMLMQSNSGYIEIFPALPEKMKDVSFKGLCARGGFEVSATRKDSKTEIEIKSLMGEKAIVKCKDISKAKGNFEIIDNDTISFSTEIGKVYKI